MADDILKIFQDNKVGFAPAMVALAVAAAGSIKAWVGTDPAARTKAQLGILLSIKSAITEMDKNDRPQNLN